MISSAWERERERVVEVEKWLGGVLMAIDSPWAHIHLTNAPNAWAQLHVSHKKTLHFLARLWYLESCPYTSMPNNNNNGCGNPQSYENRILYNVVLPKTNLDVFVHYRKSSPKFVDTYNGAFWCTGRIDENRLIGSKGRHSALYGSNVSYWFLNLIPLKLHLSIWSC